MKQRSTGCSTSAPTCRCSATSSTRARSTSAGASRSCPTWAPSAQALAGRGVAVLPRYFVRDDLAKGRLALLFKTQQLQTDFFRLIWRAEHPRHAQLEQLGA